MHRAVALAATCSGSFRSTSPTDMTATGTTATDDVARNRGTSHGSNR